MLPKEKVSREKSSARKIPISCEKTLSPKRELDHGALRIGPPCFAASGEPIEILAACAPVAARIACNL
jgi:hypothetical protein